MHIVSHFAFEPIDSAASGQSRNCLIDFLPNTMLPPTTALKVQQNVLMLTVEGRVSFRRTLRILQETFERAHENEVRKVLINWLGAVSPFSTIERYNLGSETAKYVRRRGMVLHVALVGVPPAVDGFGALVARNQGLYISVFPTVEEGLDWLK